MSKPIIFISHVTEEKEIANTLKEFLEKKFLRTVNVFVSSHAESLKIGDDWLLTIKQSMKDCQLIIILCSPISISRPWINFEAGAGWIKNIPVIPLCHSGLTPGRLPVPLNSFQGGLLNNQDDITKVFTRVSELLNISIPDSEGKDFFQAVDSFEARIQSGLLIKDMTFIYNLLYRQIELLKYSIYASTMDYDSLGKIDIQHANIQDHSFNFNDIYHLFNMSLLEITTKKVFRVYHKAVHDLIENIKFLLLYNGIQIAPRIRELLNDMLFSMVKVDDWYESINLIDVQADNQIRNVSIDMIKEEPLPPTPRNSNIINSYIDYYKSLIYYQHWLANFEMEMSNILTQ